jgi:Uma2 family endonuclease
VVAERKSTYITPQAYLEWEDAQEERHEYNNGVIVAMSGGTRDHSIITGNLALILGLQLRKSPCEVHGGGLKVYVKTCNRYFYPDIAVLCGSPSFTNGRRDTIDNPILVIEVLSESTEHFDRTTKLDCYATLPSVQAYLIVSQREQRIERYTRLTGKPGWEVTAFTGGDSLVLLPEIECELRANEVYERIEFEPAVDASFSPNDPSI